MSKFTKDWSPKRMNRSSSELKSLAKKRLSGRYGGPVGAYAIIFVITFIINSILNLIYNEESAASVITYYSATIIVSLLESVLTAGLTHYFLNFARGRASEVKDLTYGFKNHPDRFIVATLVIMFGSAIFLIPAAILTVFMSYSNTILLLIIPVVLLYVAGIVFSLRFTLGCSQAFYILNDDSEAGALEAIRKSREMMVGHKGRLFFLILSFLGWSLLGICSCGIGFLWITPYMSITQCFFYMDLTGELDMKQPEAPAAEADIDYGKYNDLNM